MYIYKLYEKSAAAEKAAKAAWREVAALKPYKKGCPTTYAATIKKARRLDAAAEKADFDFRDAIFSKFEEAAAEAEVAVAMQEWLTATEAEVIARIEADAKAFEAWDGWQKTVHKQQRAEATKAAKTAAAKIKQRYYEEWLKTDLAKTAAVAKANSLKRFVKNHGRNIKLNSKSELLALRNTLKKELIPYSMYVGGLRLCVTQITSNSFYVSVCDGVNKFMRKLSWRQLKKALKLVTKRVEIQKSLEKAQKALIEETQIRNLVEDIVNCEFYKSKDYSIGFIEKFETQNADREPSLKDIRHAFNRFENSFFEGIYVDNEYDYGHAYGHAYVHFKTDGLYKTNLEKLGEQYISARGTVCEGRKLPTTLPSRLLFTGLGGNNPQCWAFFDDDPEGVWYFHANGYNYAKKDNHLYERFKTREYRGHELGCLLNNALLKKQAAEENVDDCINDAIDNNSGASNKHKVYVTTHKRMQHHWQNTMRKPQGEGVIVKKLVAKTKIIDGDLIELTEESITDLAWTPMIGGIEHVVSPQWVKANYNPELYKFVERYTRAMIVVNLDAINDVNRLADKDTQRYHEIVCLVPIKEKEGDIFFVKKWNSEDKVWYYQGWFDEYLVLGEEEFAELVESPEYLGYWSYSGEYAVTSPGQVKQHCAILAGEWFGSKDTQENDWYVDWESLYDDLFGEAWQLWISDPNRRGYKEVSQFATRMAHWTAPATGFPKTPAGSFALFNGKFQSEYIKDRDGNLVEYEDGQDFINVAFMQCAFNKSDSRFHIMRSALLFQLFQHRSWAYCNKSDGWVIDDEGMELLFKRHGKGKVKRVKLWELSTEDKTFWDYFMQNKGKVGSCPREDWTERLENLKGAIIIFYANKKDYSEEALTADLLTDWNSLKCGFRPWVTTPYLKILAMSHDGGTKQVLSSQLIQTLVAGDPDKAWKLILGLMAIEIDKQLEKFYGQAKPETSYEDFAQLTKLEYDYNGKPTIVRTSFSRAVEELCYEFALKWDPNLYRKRAQNMFKKLNKEINNLNVPCYGVHTTLLSDIAAIFCGHSILNVDKNGIWQYYGIGDAGNVDMEVYIQAIKDLKEEEGVTDEEKAYAIKAIKGIAPGISVAPVTDEFTRGNEGSDWDSDSIFIFYLMRLLRSHVAQKLGKPDEGATDNEINEWIEKKIDKLIEFFDKDNRCGLMVDYLKLARDAKLTGEIDVALRYPNNHCEGICKLSESFIPEMLSVRIIEGTSVTDAEYLVSDTFRGQLLQELNEVIKGLRKEVAGMFPHLNKSRFCGMVQFTRYIVTGIIPPGVYISAMNIHADARFAADRLRRMCKIVDEEGEMNCRDIIKSLSAKTARTPQENVMLDSAKFLMDYAATIFGIEVDDYMSMLKSDVPEYAKKKYRYARYTFETKERAKGVRRTAWYQTPFDYEKNKKNGVYSVTVSLGTSNEVVKRARQIDDKVFIDDIYAIARDCEAVKRNGGEILIDSPKGIKDPSILGGLPLSGCTFTRQFNQTFEVVQRWAGDSLKDNKYPKGFDNGAEFEYYSGEIGGDDFVDGGYDEYADCQDCCAQTVKKQVKVANKGGFTGEYVVLIDDKDGQPAGNGNKKLKTAPGWCYNNKLEIRSGKKVPIGRTKAIEHYTLYDVAQQQSYRGCDKSGVVRGSAIDPLFRIKVACLGYLPEIVELLKNDVANFKLPEKELALMSKFSLENLKKVELPIRTLIIDAQKALFNIKGVWADVNSGLKKEEDELRKLYKGRIKAGFSSERDLEQALKLHKSLNTMAYRGCENMARLLMAELAKDEKIGMMFRDPLEQMRFVVQTLMDRGTSDIVSDFGRLVMPEEFAIWQYFVTKTYGESEIPKNTQDRLHFIDGFKDETIITPERLAKLNGKKVNLQNGALVSSDGICWAYNPNPETSGEFVLQVKEGRLYACADIVELMQKMRPAPDQNQRCIQLWGKANMVGATQRSGVSTRTCIIDRGKVMALLREHDYVYIDAEDLERLMIKDEAGRFITIGKIKCAYTFTTSMKDGNSAFYKKLLGCQARKNWTINEAQLMKGKVKVALPCEKGKGSQEYKTVGLVLEDISFETYDWKTNGYYDNSFELVKRTVVRTLTVRTTTEEVEVNEELEMKTQEVNKEPDNIGGEASSVGDSKSFYEDDGE